MIFLLNTLTDEFVLPIWFWIALVVVFVGVYFVIYKFLSKKFLPKDYHDDDDFMAR